MGNRLGSANGHAPARVGYQPGTVEIEAEAAVLPPFGRDEAGGVAEGCTPKWKGCGSPFFEKKLDARFLFVPSGGAGTRNQVARANRPLLPRKRPFDHVMSAPYSCSAESTIKMAQ